MCRMWSNKKASTEGLPPRRKGILLKLWKRDSLLYGRERRLLLLKVVYSSTLKCGGGSFERMNVWTSACSAEACHTQSQRSLHN